MKKQKKNNNTNKIIFIIAAILIYIAVIIATIAVVAGVSKKSYQEYIDDGINFMNHFEYDQAETEFLLAIELDPRKADAYKHLTNVYILTERPDDAQAILKKASQNVPNYDEDDEFRNLESQVDEMILHSSDKELTEKTIEETIEETEKIETAQEVQERRLKETVDVFKEYGFGAIWNYTDDKDYSNLSIEILGDTVQEYDDYYLAEVMLYRPLTIPKKTEDDGLYHIKRSDGSELVLEYVEAENNFSHYKEPGKPYNMDAYYTLGCLVKGEEVLFSYSYDADWDSFYKGIVKISKKCRTGIYVMSEFRQLTYNDLFHGLYDQDQNAFYNGIGMDKNGIITDLLYMGD